MKLVIITPYYSPINGGVTTYVLNLVNSIKSKYDVSLNVITREGDKSNNTISINCPKWLFVLRTFIVLNKIHPDVIHSHSWWYTLIPGVVYKYFHHGTRVIHTLHTQPMGEINKSLKTKLFSSFLSKCDVVTFVSNCHMKESQKHYEITSPMKVIYVGVNSKEVNEGNLMAIKTELALGNRRPIITFIGLMVHKKKAEGVRILIEAIKLLKTKYPNICLLIIGDGDFRKNIEEIVDNLNMKDNIIFTGFKDNIFDYLALTDIYAHISLQEALGISILEAMSMGVPVIASNTGGIPEVIRNRINGLLVNPEPEIIAKNIQELYEDKNMRMALGNFARLDVERRFGMERFADDFAELYELNKKLIVD